MQSCIVLKLVSMLTCNLSANWILDKKEYAKISELVFHWFLNVEIIKIKTIKILYWSSLGLIYLNIQVKMIFKTDLIKNFI